MRNSPLYILSFIVPVYNVAPYLRKCVDSLLVQDYEDYEIILVDDGSTDESGAICDEYIRVTSEGVNELTNERIRVIHQKNGGLSAARNTGVAAAKGEYICFVDSDDYWQPNVLGGLMAQVEREQLDVLRFDYKNVKIKNEGVKELMNEREYEVFEPNKYPHPVDKRTEIVSGERYLDERMSYACYAWQFVLRRNLLFNSLTHSFVNSFTEGIHFEDVDWMPRMMLQAKRVNSTSMIVYNYLVRPGSITKTQGNKEKIRKNVEDNMVVVEHLSQMRKLHPNSIWLHNMLSMTSVGILLSVARHFYSERDQYICQLREMQVCPLSIADQGRTYTRRAKIINIFGVHFFCFLMHVMKP